MAFDTSIYSQIKPIEVPNPLAQAAQVAQLQGAQNQNALAQYSLSKARRDDEMQSNLLRDLATADGDWDAVQRAYVKAGHADKAASILKDRTAQLKSQAEIDEKNLTIAAKRYGIYKQSLGALAQEPNLSKDMVMQAGQELVQQGILPFAMYQKAIGNLPDDPIQLRARLVQGVKSQLTPEQMFTVFAPKPQQIDNGRTISYMDMNPNSPTYGKPTGVAAVQKQITPGQAATLAQSERHFQIGQNTPQYMDTDQGVVALPKKPVAGQPIVGQPVMGADGKPLQKKQNIPQYVVQGLAENEKTAAVIEKALSQLQTPEGKNAVGLKGYLPQPILNRVDQQGVNTRADISDIGSMTVKDRSGATVTVAESPRLMPFIPSATDDYVTAGKKLRRMLQLIREDSEALTAFHPGAKAALDQVRAGKSTTAPDATAKPAVLPQGWSVKEH